MRYRVVYTMLTRWEMVIDAKNEDAAKRFDGDVEWEEQGDGTPYDVLSVKPEPEEP